MHSTDPRPVLDMRMELGESPCWDPQRETLHFVDITAGRIHSLAVRSGRVTSLDVGQPVGAVAVRAAGGLVVACRDGFAIADPVRGDFHLIAPVEREVIGNRMNDGKCDPSGRFWAGTQADPLAHGAGALYRLDSDRSVTKVLDGVTVSNGVGWSPDGTVMYYIDTATGGVDAFDHRASDGSISGRRRIIDVPPWTGADGMTVDREGRLWVALWGGWAVRCHAPDGRLLGEIRLPVSHVTSCTFGGPDMQDLYVTTSSRDEDGPFSSERLAGQPLAGSLFVARPGAIGIASTEYLG